MKPLMVRVVPGHSARPPASGAMIMNISANFLGLGNACNAGLKAMENSTNSAPVRHGHQCHSMVLFLAINTAGLTLLAPASWPRCPSRQHQPSRYWRRHHFCHRHQQHDRRHCRRQTDATVFSGGESVRNRC
ncbi:MAG: hypothetical protein R2857_04190 [Vampirovibrionales bacterium]